MLTKLLSFNAAGSATRRGMPRRKFLTTVTKTVAAGSLATLDISRFAHAAGSGVIRLGLVGCGGRGSGAAHNALEAGKDVRLVAMADVLPEKIASSLNSLKSTPVASQLDVTDDRRFSGFDAYEHLLAVGVDGVIFATPPGFRPLHFKAAIQAGVHCFLEKPVAVDAPGVRSVRAAAEEAKRKGRSVIVGFHEHYDKSYTGLISQISNGVIGKIVKLNAVDRMTDVPRRVQRWDDELQRPLTEMEFQLRNWWRFAWLSGDRIVELLVHGIDTCVWAKGSPPQNVQGRSERREHTSSNEGDISDFLSVKYRYADGTEMLAEVSALASNTGVWQTAIEGEQGIATAPNKIVDRQGRVIWSYSGPKTEPHQEEMNQWCGSIRQGRPLNTVASAADSTLVAIMGRTAAYTGLEVTWTEIQRSPEALFVRNPKSFQDDPPNLPDKFGDYQAPPRGTVSASA